MSTQSENSQMTQSGTGFRVRTLPAAHKAVAFMFMIAGACYLYWRLGTLNPDAIFFSTILWLAEAYGYFMLCLFLWSVWNITERTDPPPLPGHTVDVFVTTLNEPVEIARRTLLAAKRMTYPNQTWLLDDGNREELRRLCEEMGMKYLCRTKRDHAKAGALNEAMKQATGEFVVVFDVDHAPEKDFLDRTMGWFADPKVAFVQTAHEYCNVDSFQHCSRPGGKKIWHEQQLFYRVSASGKDYCNAAFFCGSGGVIRRSALDQVGGFAGETITEDMHTALRMHRRGWKSIYVAEPMSYGIAPHTMQAYLRQRFRWATGNMHVWWKEKIPFGRGLTWRQRLSYLSGLIGYFEGWQRAVFYVTPSLVLLFGIMPVKALTLNYLAIFVPYYILSVLAYSLAGRGFGWWIETEHFSMARFAAYISATVAWIFRPRFRVTPKARTHRQRSDIVLIPQYAVFILNIVAIPIGIISTLRGGFPPWRATAISAGWAMLNASLAWGVIAAARHCDRVEEPISFDIPELSANETSRVLPKTAEGV